MGVLCWLSPPAFTRVAGAAAVMVSGSLKPRIAAFVDFCTMVRKVWARVVVAVKLTAPLLSTPEVPPGKVTLVPSLENCTAVRFRSPDCH